MSKKTGIPLSTLAKVEQGRLTLGYDKLLQIGQRCKMRISELLSVADASEARVMIRRSVGTLRTAIRVDSPNFEYFLMCQELLRKRMTPFVVRLHAKTLEEFGQLVRHAGEEFIYILTGCVEVHTEFYEPITLGVGQYMYIDSNMGHAYLLGADCEEAWLVGGCSSGDGLLESLTESQRNHRLRPAMRSRSLTQRCGTNFAEGEDPSTRMQSYP
jgi:transcriptional regulator with XRE-family HTH domain